VRCVRAANRPRSNPRHSDRTARRDRRVRKNARARAVAGSHAATTRSELREKLIATGASRDEADAVLDEIAGLGYLRRASRMRWSARRPVR
jgi:SOS response regulatory protein OraA/RecX